MPHEVGALLPGGAGQQVGFEPVLQAHHGVDGLRLVGGIDVNDPGFPVGEDPEEIGHEIGQELIFPGLAGNDDHDRAAGVGGDAVIDGLGGLELVRAHFDSASTFCEVVEVACDGFDGFL